MNTLNYILEKYKIKGKMHEPTEIPDIRRRDLGDLFRELEFKVGVEVGTAEGKFAEVLCAKNPDLKLYCVDPWEMYEDFKEILYTPWLEIYYQSTKIRLAPYNCEIIRKYSLDAVKDFEDNSLDFVYIDGNHALPSVINDIHQWIKKVRPGGIISGDDYMYSKKEPNITHHVYQAVRAYTWAYKIRPWFILGLSEKLPGLKRDHTRSWMWVKQ